MFQAMRRPEEILAYRTLRQILVAKPKGLWSAAPGDSVLKALQAMTDRNVGLLVVLDQGRLAGVVTERDCIRRAVLGRKPLETTPIDEIMVRQVVTVDVEHTYADCLRLMHQHAIRHLPVLDGDKVVAVVSIRDLLREAVTHNAKVIAEVELERLTMFTSMA
jgi:signal-transduction protein with cAMP-binding, CBS, and nucleotidyltransferase domain